jgi:hypothetical protein
MKVWIATAYYADNASGDIDPIAVVGHTKEAACDAMTAALATKSDPNEWIETGPYEVEVAPAVAGNVYDYFGTKMGSASTDSSLKDLPCDSNCGKDCVSAIDAASSLMQHMRDATGDANADFFLSVVECTDDVVQTYWRG